MNETEMTLDQARDLLCQPGYDAYGSVRVYGVIGSGECAGQILSINHPNPQGLGRAERKPPMTNVWLTELRRRGLAMRPEDLNEAMPFDRVVYVDFDGTVTPAPDVYGPDCVLDDEICAAGWALMRGYTGQDRYSGPTMHPSEYIGGRLAEDILATPGFYVVLTSHTSDPEFADDDVAGWAIAYRPA